MVEAHGELDGKTTANSLWRDTLSAQSEFSTGFDGILLFVAICRVASPLFAGYNLYVDLRVLTQPGIWHAFVDARSPPAYRYFIEVAFGGAIGNLFCFLFGLILMWLFFRRRRAFRSAVIAYLLLNVAITFGILMMMIMFSLFNWEYVFYAGISALWASFWIPYFTYSDRVKNTFVR